MKPPPREQRQEKDEKISAVGLNTWLAAISPGPPPIFTLQLNNLSNSLRECDRASYLAIASVRPIVGEPVFAVLFDSETQSLKCVKHP